MLKQILFLVHVSIAQFIWEKSSVSEFAKVDPISHTRDTHFYDLRGRQRFFRGLNVVYKGFPYHPKVDSFDPVTSFSLEDVQLLSDLNMNIIRLGLSWQGVEPVRGQYNQTYIAVMKRIVEMCATKVQSCLNSGYLRTRRVSSRYIWREAMR